MDELTPEETRQKVRDLITEMGFNKAKHAVKIMQINVADNLNQEVALNEIEKRERALRRWSSFKSTAKSSVSKIVIGLIIAVGGWWIIKHGIPWFLGVLDRRK